MMAETNWLDILGWTDEHIEKMRYTGYSYMREGHFHVAKIFFEALVVLHPESLYDVQALGAISLEQGKNEEALDLFDQALKLKPDDLSSQLNKAKALLGMGRVQEALELANPLQKCKDPLIANDASALVMSYS